MQQDYAHTERQALIATCEPVTRSTVPNIEEEIWLAGERIKAKTAEAILKMGDKWVLNSAYSLNPRHSAYTKHSDVLTEVTRAARKAGRL